jgi:ligand-binding sensor protein
VKNTSENILDKIAEESGFAAVVLDDQGREIGSSNNNSICSILYHSHEFAPKCAEFCGEALKRSERAEDTIEYHCHVGLYCRAKALKHDEKSLVAIVGRAFTKADRSAAICSNFLRISFSKMF